MRTLTYAGALNEALRLEMRRDPNIYVAGEDVGVYGGIFGVTSGLLDEFGSKRVRYTPITESAIIGLAVGAAAAGLRPVVELMFIDFIGVALDQLFNQALSGLSQCCGAPLPHVEDHEATLTQRACETMKCSASVYIVDDIVEHAAAQNTIVLDFGRELQDIADPEIHGKTAAVGLAHRHRQKLW